MKKLKNISQWKVSSIRFLIFLQIFSITNSVIPQELIIGFFQVSKQNIPIAAKIGAHIIHHYHFEGWKDGKYKTGNNKEAIEYLDLAQKHNLKVMMGFDRYSMIKNDIQHIEDRVDSLKNHPALVYWYLADEPDVSFISQARCQYFYRLIKRFDPRHPIVVTISSNSPKLSNYDEAADIIIVDSYPIRDDYNLDKMGNIKYRVKLAKMALEEKRKSKKIFTGLQAFEKKYDNIAYRFPNLEETKYMALSGIFEGAEGVFFYSFDLSTTEHINQVLKPTIENLNIFNNYETIQLNNDEKFPVAVIKKENSIFYIIANNLIEPVSRDFFFIDSLAPVELDFKPLEIKTLMIQEFN
jgi:hypothetical protein